MNKIKKCVQLSWELAVLLLKQMLRCADDSRWCPSLVAVCALFVQEFFWTTCASCDLKSFVKSALLYCSRKEKKYCHWEKNWQRLIAGKPHAFLRLYRKIRNSKNEDSVFSVKDMHCWPVLTYLLSPIEWLTFCQKSLTCYYFLWKNWISIFGFPLFSGYAVS